MRNMFYKYDNDIKDHQFLAFPETDSIERLQDCNCAEYLYNIKDELIGIKAKLGSSFKLYFNFSSDQFEEMTETLSKYQILLDILDFKYDNIKTLVATYDAEISEAEISIDCSELELKSGVYKLKLYYIDEFGLKYNLYADENLLLDIR